MPPAKSQPAPLRVPPDPRPHRYPAPVEFPESDGEPMAESTLHRRVTIDVTHAAAGSLPRVLGLELRLENDRLRFFDAETGTYLLTSAEKEAVIHD